jgi:acyl transferase domain-containing protein
VVVLKPLSLAERDGDRVLAVIRATAINHDGKSQALTAPNGAAQEYVIRRALSEARIAPSTVDYLECHGTGTSLGDPIEVQAAAAVFGLGRDAEHPLLLGSVKSNIGHTDATAGVAGLIKVVLALHAEQIPRSLHFSTPNPEIPWSSLPVKVAATPTRWARSERVRRAGVSSFGLSGTNAHAVVEEAPLHDGRGASATPLLRLSEIVVLSGKSPDALNAAAARLCAHLGTHPEQALADVAFSLAASRTHHGHRLSVTADSRSALAEALSAASRGELPARATRAEVPPSRRKLAWLFTGQGSQRLGMGRELASAWPVFHEAIEAAFAALDPHLPRPLRSVLWAEAGSPEASSLDETEYAQPALFALEVSLAALWRSWGIEPDFVAGHSLGELAAAHAAGVFSLEDAARLVTARGRLMQALPAGGAMVAIGAAEAEVDEALCGHEGAVSIAAINGPSAVVISGVEGVVQEIASSFATRGVETKRLLVSHAFHSPLMDPMLEDFRRVAESIEYDSPRIPLISTVAGTLAGSEVAHADYWVRHVRSAVRFSEGTKTLGEAGAETFVELGPTATLLGLVPECLVHEEVSLGGDAHETPSRRSVSLVAAMRREVNEVESVLGALGNVFAHGAEVDWTGVFPPHRRRVELPTYPWQRQRYPLPPETSTSSNSARTEHSLEAELRRLVASGSLSEAAIAALPEILKACESQRARETGEIRATGELPNTVPQRPALRSMLEALEVDDRGRHLQGWLCRECVSLLGRGNADALDVQRGFAELGLDSLMGAALRRRIEEAVGTKLPVSILFNHPNITKLARHLLDHLDLGSGPKSDEDDPLNIQHMPDQELLALLDREFGEGEEKQR